MNVQQLTENRGLLFSIHDRSCAGRAYSMAQRGVMDKAFEHIVLILSATVRAGFHGGLSSLFQGNAILSGAPQRTHEGNHGDNPRIRSSKNSAFLTPQ